MFLFLTLSAMALKYGVAYILKPSVPNTKVTKSFLTKAQMSGNEVQTKIKEIVIIGHNPNSQAIAELGIQSGPRKCFF